MKEIIKTENAPSAIGPYSQAIKANGFVYVSGQIPIDPATGEFAGTDVQTQTRQCLKNIKAIVLAAGTSLENMVKVNVFLTDMNNFALMNEVYAEFFPENPPARAAVEVGALPKNALVEIEAIALAE